MGSDVNEIMSVQLRINSLECNIVMFCLGENIGDDLLLSLSQSACCPLLPPTSQLLLLLLLHLLLPSVLLCINKLMFELISMCQLMSLRRKPRM